MTTKTTTAASSSSRDLGAQILGLRAASPPPLLPCPRACRLNC